MPECSFCHKHYDIPWGLTYVLDNGEILYFCSGKCRKNLKLGRKSEKVNWIRKKNKIQKSVSVDSKNEKS